MLFVIPTSSLQVNTINVASILRFFSDVGMGSIIHYSVFKWYFIDGDHMFPCKVLKVSCDKSLREEEPWNPEHIRCTMVNPFLQEVNSVNEILCPGSEWLHGKEANIGPDFWDLVIKQWITHFFQLFTHNNLSFQSFLSILYCFNHNF